MSRGRHPVPYNPREYTVWKEQAKRLVEDALPEPLGETAGDFEVHLIVEARRPKTTKLTRPKPDVDNYAKGVLDAITESSRVWADDHQVASLTVTKRWAPEGADPGIHIIVTPFLQDT